MYPACKFALTALTECLRQEISYIEMGIKVTVGRERDKKMNKCKENETKEYSIWFCWFYSVIIRFYWCFYFAKEKLEKNSAKSMNHEKQIWKFIIFTILHKNVIFISIVIHL